MPDGICPFAEFIPGVRTYSRGNGGRVGFCDHAAGGFMTTMENPAFWNEAGTSVHFAIGRDGKIIQLVNIFDTAFAQGALGPRVTWPPYDAMGGGNPNDYLISTEHEDYVLVGNRSTAVPGSQWTPAQYDADLRLKRWCVDEVARVLRTNLMVYKLDSLAGHFMFDSVNRVNCPGLYWTREYRNRLYNDLVNQGGPEPMFVRHNGDANPSYWNRRDIHGPTGFAARSDFNLPVEAKAIEVEIFLFEGGFDVKDGGADTRAGYAHAGDSPGRFRVKLDDDGNCWFDGDARIDRLACLGYYT